MYWNGAEQFADFELIDSGDGYRLERWGTFTLARPDPQAIWERSQPAELWASADAAFRNSQWESRTQLPESWNLSFRGAQFITKPTSFKHTGVFPEQAVNWQWMTELLAGMERPEVLNLFAYTGAATMVLARAGAFVTHVDASRPAVSWAKENHALNELPADSVRWMLDDAVKFVKKEVRREARYQGIVMDPPAFGHGPSGSIWKFNRDLPKLVADAVQLLAPDAQFFLVNAYATNSSPLALRNVLEDALRGREGTIQEGELCLAQRNGRLVSVGICARWTKST